MLVNDMPMHIANDKLEIMVLIIGMAMTSMPKPIWFKQPCVNGMLVNDMPMHFGNDKHAIHPTHHWHAN
jgi:hypothetical protein